MSPEQPYALVIDTTRSRLFVYQNAKELLKIKVYRLALLGGLFSLCCGG